jgi:ankyrin repeat protein
MGGDRGDEEAVRVLLDAKADPNAANHQGNSPTMVALSGTCLISLFIFLIISMRSPTRSQSDR